MVVELLCCFLRHPEPEKEMRAFTEYLLSLPLPNLNKQSQNLVPPVGSWKLISVISHLYQMCGYVRGPDSCSECPETHVQIKTKIGSHASNNDLKTMYKLSMELHPERRMAFP